MTFSDRSLGPGVLASCQPHGVLLMPRTIEPGPREGLRAPTYGPLSRRSTGIRRSAIALSWRLYLHTTYFPQELQRRCQHRRSLASMNPRLALPANQWALGRSSETGPRGPRSDALQ